MGTVSSAEVMLRKEIEGLRTRVAELELERRIPADIVEKSPVMISIVLAPDFIYQFVNPAFQAQAPGKEFLGRRVADVWAEGSGPLVEILRNVIDTGRTIQLEDAPHPIQRGPGAPPDAVSISYSCVPLPGPDGKPDRVLTLAHEMAAPVRPRQPNVESNRSSQENEAILSSFFDSPGMMRGIVEVVDGRIIHVSCNGAAARMYGIDRDSIAGKSATETGASEAVVQTWAGLYEDSRRSGKAVSMEYARRDADGGDRWLLATASYLAAGPSGNPRFAYAILDLTDRKRAEDALHKQRQLLEVTLQSIGDAVLATDADGRIIFFNPVAAALTGWTEEQAVGQPAGDVLRTIDELTRQAAEDIVGRVLRLGCAVSMANHTALIARGGREIPIEDSAAPIRDSAGNVLGAVLVFHDVTAKRRADRALRESEARLRTLSDNLPEGAIYRYRHDVHGEPHVDFISAGIERLTGVPAAEFMADAAAVIRNVLPDDRERLSAAIVASRERLTRFEVEVRHRHRVTGEIRWSLMRSTPTRNPDGSTVWDGIELDITERKRADEEMAWLASFPELNPNPIVEIEPLAGAVEYVNAAGRRLFPDLRERGFSHPWLAGLEPVAKKFANGDGNNVLREVTVGGDCYQQSANYTVEKARLRVYGIDITERKRAEDVLRESVRRERFLAGILEASEQPFAIGYPDGRLGICNRAYCELTGYSMEELHSLSWTASLTPPEWAEKEMAGLAELERTGKPVRYQKEYVRKDGQRVPVELLVHLTRDESGKAEFYYSFLTDITERRRIDETLRRSRDELELRVRERTEELSSANKTLAAQVQERERAQAALHQSELAFRTLAESVPQLVWICNPDGLNVYFNQRWVEYTGMTLEESYGRGWNTPFHPDDKQAAWRAWNHAVESGDTYSVESRLRRADGSYRWFLTRGVPSRDGTGEIVKWFGTCTDIDDLKQAEQEARSARERLALALKVGHSGTFEWDIRSNVTVWTPELEELHGLAPGTFSGRYEDWEPLLLPEDLLHVRACFEESLKTGEFFAEWRIRHAASGEIRWIVANAKVSFDEEGRPLRVTGFNRDITERKLAEMEVLRLNQDLERRVAERTIQLERIAAELEKRNREVERVNRMKTEFLARSSHELRTPLNAIMGYADLLSEQAAGTLPPPYPRFVGNIQEGARHLLDMVNDLLDISRIEAGRIELNLERFDVAAALDEVLSVIGPLAEIKRIAVESRIPRESAVVADRLRFKQILYNLTSNAVKFTPEEGRVWIETAVDGEILTICVGDTGIGIAVSEQEAIFEEFHQVVSARIPAAAGSGLGLAITRKLVQLHGGEVRVESELGKGSRFLVSLPVAAKSSAPGRMEVNAEGAGSGR